MKKLYIILFLMLLYSFYLSNNIKSKFNDETIIEGIITNYYYKDDKTYIYLKSKEKVLCIYDNVISLNTGDSIRLTGNLSIPSSNTIFNTFNYKDYLKYEGINYIFNTSDISLISTNKSIRYKIKNYIINRIDSIPNNTYLYTFILGNNKYIDTDIKNSYINNGISHLFSISGMHISFLTLIILKLFNKFKYKDYICIIFLLFYMFLTDFSPSVIRSSILYILITINNRFKLNISKDNIMIILLIICILIDPFIIYKVGFKYSFIITYSLIKFNKIINKNNIFLSSLLISIISFIVSIPISINMSYKINLLSIIYNLFFIPLISLIIFPLSLITFIIPNNIFNILINTIESISLYLSSINILVINLCKMSIIFVIIYYLIIYYVFRRLEDKKYKYLIIILLVLFIHNNICLVDSSLKVVVLDVKNGDSILIKLPNNKGNILIDTGEYNIDNIITYLRSIGINKLNYLIISHGGV